MGYSVACDGRVVAYLWVLTSSETKATTSDLIGEVKSIGAIQDGEKDKHENTNFMSKVKTYTMGLGDPGNYEITQNLTKEVHDRLKTLKDSKSKLGIGVVFKDETGTVLASRQNTCDIANVTIPETSVNGGVVELKTSFNLDGPWTTDFTEPTVTE